MTRTFVLLCLSFTIHQHVNGFLIPKFCHHRSPPPGVGTTTSLLPMRFVVTTTNKDHASTTSLSAKKTGGGGGGGGSKRRSGGSTKKKATNKKGNNRKNTKRNESRKNKRDRESSSSQPAATTGGGGGGSVNNHTPPWKVMSTKDTQKNIQNEIQRRNAVRSGTIPSSSSTLSDTTTTQSSSPHKADISASSSLLTSTDRRLYNWKRFSPDKDILGLKFIDAYLGTRSIPPLPVPEIAFLGRSNVGKSSLLNRLAKRSSGTTTTTTNTNTNTNSNTQSSSASYTTARVGKTPGATASVNLYTLHGRKSRRKQTDLLGFADLPGFGYAKLSKETKESVEIAAERYLARRKNLVLGVLLVDVRRVPSSDDRAVLAALYDNGVPLVVVTTKVDKLGSNAREKAVEGVRVALGLPEGQPLCVSSVTGEGVRELWKIVLDACEEKVDEWRGEDVYEQEEDEEYLEENGDGIGGYPIGEKMDLEGGVVQFDVQGNWIGDDMEEDEMEYDQGYEWAHNYDSEDYYDDEGYDNDYYDDDDDDDRTDGYVTQDSKRKMIENEQMQAAASEAMKLRNLRKKVKKMQKEKGGGIL